MKVYVINNNGEKEQVTLKMVDNVPSWVTLQGQIIGDVDNLPESVKLAYDCSTERQQVSKQIVKAIVGKGWKRKTYGNTCSITRKTMVQISEGVLNMNIETLIRSSAILGKRIVIDASIEEEPGE